MPIIRPMQQEDADIVREIDSIAFWNWAKGVRGEAAPQYKRTRTNVLALWEKDPGGCFVAEEGADVVGFIFSRTWGGIGWLGTFAVLPECQGRGIGRQLIQASLAYLRQDPDRIIGLETMPESPYNIGLYLKLGFQARLPVITLQKAFQRPAEGEAGLQHWSSAEAATRVRWLSDLREATGRILPGLNYTKEITATARHDLGETLVMIDRGRAVGVSIVELVSSMENWGQEQARVAALSLHPAYTTTESLRALVDGSEALAQAQGKKSLRVAVHSRHTWPLQRLLEWGYRVEGMAVRLVLAGTDRGPAYDNLVDLARWAA